MHLHALASEGPLHSRRPIAMLTSRSRHTHIHATTPKVDLKAATLRLDLVPDLTTNDHWDLCSYLMSLMNHALNGCHNHCYTLCLLSVISIILVISALCSLFRLASPGCYRCVPVDGIVVLPTEALSNWFYWHWELVNILNISFIWMLCAAECWNYQYRTVWPAS